MNTALISLASNSPDKREQMEQAFAELRAMGIVARSSSIYETAPYGNPRHPNYLNAVACIRTAAEYPVLYDTLKEMERAHGRTPQSKLSAQDYERDYFKTGLHEIQPVENQQPHPIVSH